MAKGANTSATVYIGAALLQESNSKMCVFKMLRSTRIDRSRQHCFIELDIAMRDASSTYITAAITLPAQLLSIPKRSDTLESASDWCQPGAITITGTAILHASIACKLPQHMHHSPY